ncbi:MAG TPA: hypothetical protein VJ783_23255 [Pirellulales bacterium]|nr:hypothetical protein [Pirellulales bacterium]
MSDGVAAIRKLLLAVFRPLKSAGRFFERRLARRLSERYADEITQFDDLGQAMRELGEQVHARLDKQEGFQWDHVALARRLARLEDHVEQLLRRQAASGLVPGRSDGDAEAPAARIGAKKETNHAELIPFRAPMRCAEKHASSQEAA